MKQILIKTISEFKEVDLTSYEVKENIEINVQIKLVDEKLIKPIKVIHLKPDLESKIFIKLALYGNSSAEVPVEIWVKEGAKNTSTNFKALVFLMSEKAKANITPGLFIHEKEIASAGHGVVIKSIKDKDTFYLQSRGIEKKLARELIVGI